MKPLSVPEPQRAMVAGGTKSPTIDVPALDTSRLFATTKVVKIVHDQQVYTLRLTKENKLILTK
jgi:hemin uptake protein HemP